MPRAQPNIQPKAHIFYHFRYKTQEFSPLIITSSSEHRKHHFFFIHFMLFFQQQQCIGQLHQETIQRQEKSNWWILSQCSKLVIQPFCQCEDFVVKVFLNFLDFVVEEHVHHFLVHPDSCNNSRYVIGVFFVFVLIPSLIVCSSLRIWDWLVLDQTRILLWVFYLLVAMLEWSKKHSIT